MHLVLVYTATLLVVASGQDLVGPAITTEGGNLKFATQGDIVFEAGPSASVKFQAADGSSMPAPEGLKGQKGMTGATGAQGPPGPQGLMGETGSPGTDGAKGDTGMQGESGEQGPQGEQGPPGPPGVVTDGDDRVIQAQINWNQCVFVNLNSDKDYGLLAECSLQKQRNDTWLRLTWDGNMRIARCQFCCMNWYLTIDGHQCSYPARVDTILYQLSNNLIVRHGHFTGMCRAAGGSNITAGLRRVQLSLKDCPGFDGYVYDAYTGWNSVSRLIVEEVSPINPESETPPVTPPEGYQYRPNYCQVTYSSLGLNRERNLGVLTTVKFNKQEDFSVLRITWEGNMRHHRCTSCCARWFVTIDGSECSAYNKIETAIYSSTAYSIFFPTTITGLCTEAAGKPIGSGMHSIRLEVSNCPGYGIADLATGYESTSRFIIEELPRSLDTLFDTSGFYHPKWHQCTLSSLNSNIDEGVVVGTNCSYQKVASDSALKVTWDVNLRVTSCSECCARWYVTFNGEECSDPAPIDGVIHSINGSQVNIHRSSTLSGVCRGTESGPLISSTVYSVELNVENCGEENISAFTGFQGVSVVLIEELPDPKPQSNSPNYTQCVFRNVNTTDSGNDTALMECQIDKMRDDTSLRLSWDGNIGLVACSVCCMRWYLTINGEECANPLPIDAAINQDLTTAFRSRQFDMRRPATIAGVCNGPVGGGTYPAGTYTIELFVDQCDGYDDSYSVITGYESVSRFILEEVEPENSCEVL